MAAAIGLRIYQTTITKDGEIAPVKFISGDEASDPHVFIHRYFTDPAVIISDNDAQRSWYVTELHYADQSKRNFSASHDRGWPGSMGDFLRMENHLCAGSPCNRSSDEAFYEVPTKQPH